MPSKRFNFRPIYPGFSWEMTLRVDATPAVFPEGVKLRAQLHPDVDSGPEATITSEAGNFERIDDARILIKLDAATTARLTGSGIVFDLVRTDGSEPQHLGIRLSVDVILSLTSPR